MTAIDAWHCHQGMFSLTSVGFSYLFIVMLITCANGLFYRNVCLRHFRSPRRELEMGCGIQSVRQSLIEASVYAYMHTCWVLFLQKFLHYVEMTVRAATRGAGSIMFILSCVLREWCVEWCACVRQRERWLNCYCSAPCAPQPACFHSFEQKERCWKFWKTGGRRGTIVEISHDCLPKCLFQSQTKLSASEFQIIVRCMEMGIR